MIEPTNPPIRFKSFCENFRHELEIRYRSSVEKDIARHPQGIRKAALNLLSSLAEEPFPSGSRKLKGVEKRYRLRAAREYRIVYSAAVAIQTITIEFVGHRKDAYRGF